MNFKIYEEALASALKRIEALEEKISRIPIPGKDGFYPPVINNTRTGKATDKQLSYIQTLGGAIYEGMTKEVAGKFIDKLLNEKEINELEYKEEDSVIYEEPKEVDTDEAGVDAEGLLWLSYHQYFL